jgi:hypothetical protein
MTNLNKGFNPSTKNETDAKTQVISKMGDLHKETQKSFGVQRQLAIAVCDYAWFMGSKKNNLDQVPDGKVLRTSLNKIIEEQFNKDDTDIINRLKSSVSDAVKLAQLAIGEGTGFHVGYRKEGRTEDCKKEVPENKAVKNGKILNGFIQDFFADESQTFPNMKVNGTPVPRPSVPTCVPQTFIRDAWSIKFGDGKLDADEVGIEREERIKDEERDLSFKTSGEWLRTLQTLSKLLNSNSGYLHLVTDAKKQKELSDLFVKVSGQLTNAVKENDVENSTAPAGLLDKLCQEADFSHQNLKSKVA